jgi:hypothetical protein
MKQEDFPNLEPEEFDTTKFDNTYPIGILPMDITSKNGFQQVLNKIIINANLNPNYILIKADIAVVKWLWHTFLNSYPSYNWSQYVALMGLWHPYKICLEKIYSNYLNIFWLPILRAHNPNVSRRGELIYLGHVFKET